MPFGKNRIHKNIDIFYGIIIYNYDRQKNKNEYDRSLTQRYNDSVNDYRYHASAVGHKFGL